MQIDVVDINKEIDLWLHLHGVCICIYVYGCVERKLDRWIDR